MSTAIAALFRAIRYAVVACIMLGMTTVIFAYATELYPVAIVDGSPVWMRTWKHATKATVRYLNTERRARGEAEIPALGAVEREVLTSLIEDKIIQKEGNALVEGFGSVVGEEAGRIMRRSGQEPAQVARDVYGLTVEEYRALILFPFVRREVIRNALAARGTTFEEWMFQRKAKEPIALYFVPYRWNGQVVE